MQVEAMTGQEMRAIRADLGWTLSQLAHALDMSETYVGQMERGQRPIERRTNLAVRYIVEHHGNA